MNSEARQRSRRGCLTCRQKRKKCDEAKPTCTRCARGGEYCVWPPPRAPKRSGPPARGHSQLPRVQPHSTTAWTNSQNSSSSPSLIANAQPNCSTADDESAQHASTESLDLFNLQKDSRILEGNFIPFIPTPYANFSTSQLYSASEPPLEPGFQTPPHYMLNQPTDVLIVPQTRRFAPITPEYASEHGVARLDGELDEDEEAAFKTTEWLPTTRHMIRTLILNKNESRLSRALDAYLTFFVRYSYDPARIQEITPLLCARIGASESGRLAVLSTANLFQSFLDSSTSPVVLRRRAEELIGAARDALQLEMALFGTTLADKLAGISEISNYHYYSGDIAAYQKCIDQATPIVKTLIGPNPLKFHELHTLNALDIQIFVWSDVFSSLVMCRPTRLVYYCNVEELLRENQEGPKPGQTRTEPGLEWLCGLPNALMMLTIQIVNLRHSQYSPTERLVQAARIESALRDWKVWPNPTTNSIMKVQRMSAQEIWRHFVTLYLYQAIYKASPSNEAVQQSVKQIVRLASTLRPGHNPDCLLYAPYFIAGTFAVSTQHKHFLKTRILGCNIEPHSKRFVAALEDIWRDSKDFTVHHDWSTRSPPIAIVF